MGKSYESLRNRPSGHCFPRISARLYTSQTASLKGTVTDATGAVVPQAKITAQSVATNAMRLAVTDESGIYRITNLAPGTYDVLIEKTGFKSVEFSQIALTVDHVQNLDATLTVSSFEAKVKVTGDSVPPIALNDAQIGNILTGEQISSLPLVLRDPYQLILLSPGANQSNSILGGLSVNGSRERNNNFLLDGTDNNDADIPGLSLTQPGLTSLNPDAVQEFRVMTSNLLPEFGRNTGAVVDIITKSGTNGYNADLYWFGRYDALGARDFFDHELNAAGQVVPKDAQHLRRLSRRSRRAEQDILVRQLRRATFLDDADQPWRRANSGLQKRQVHLRRPID